MPAWRDGALGATLQRSMAATAAKRFFDYGGISTTNRPLFNTAAAWCAFSRLINHCEQLLIAQFGQPDTWEDNVNTRFRELWKGEYDHECVTFCAAAGAHLDSSTGQMQQRIMSDLPCISRLLKSIEETRALGSVCSVSAVASTAAAGSAEAEKNTEGAGAKDGVIGTDVDGFQKMTAAEKKNLAAELTARAKTDREAMLKQAISYQASAILRSRVRVVKKIDAVPPSPQKHRGTHTTVTSHCCALPMNGCSKVKHYLESDSRGLSMRMGYLDVTMPAELQTSTRSRSLCKEPCPCHAWRVTQSVSRGWLS